MKKDLALRDEQIQSAHYEVKEGDALHLDLACFSCFPDGVSLVVDVRANASFYGAFADFSEQGGKFSLVVNLLGEGASCDWHLASLCGKAAEKNFSPSVYHKAAHTTALMSNYGITHEQGRLSFRGTSEIEKGARGSKTRQEAKIIVFDPASWGSCSPALNIEENDVEASHAAAAGKLSEDHLFYLLSRGLTMAEAKKLITLGYLRPIVGYFANDKLKDEVSARVEGGLLHD